MRPQRRKEDGSNSFKSINLELAHFVAGDDRVEYYRNQNNIFFRVREFDGAIQVRVADVQEVEDFVRKYCPDNLIKLYCPEDDGSIDVRLTLNAQQRTVLNYLCAQEKKRKKEILEQHLSVWLEEQLNNLLNEKDIDLRL